MRMAMSTGASVLSSYRVLVIEYTDTTNWARTHVKLSRYLLPRPRAEAKELLG
jgi:hypothetical protein